MPVLEWPAREYRLAVHLRGQARSHRPVPTGAPTGRPPGPPTGPPCGALGSMDIPQLRPAEAPNDPGATATGRQFAATVQHAELPAPAAGLLIPHLPGWSELQSRSGRHPVAPGAVSRIFRRVPVYCGAACSFSILSIGQSRRSPAVSCRITLSNRVSLPAVWVKPMSSLEDSAWQSIRKLSR